MDSRTDQKKGGKAAARDRLRYPVTAGLAVHPLWTHHASVPPFLTATFGFKKGRIEYSMFVGVAPAYGPDHDDTFMSLYPPSGSYGTIGARLHYYSYESDRFRLRHSISLGVLTNVISKNRDEDDVFKLPVADAHLADFLVRLTGDLWVEIMPCTLSFPGIYEIALNLRYEL